MENIIKLVSVFNRLLKNRGKMAVSQIYGELYNSQMFRDFVINIGINSYEIIISVYALYFMMEDENLSINEAAHKAANSLRLIQTFYVDYTEPLTTECGNCDGSGKELCDDCGGEGELECGYCDGEGKVLVDGEYEECEECNGYGENSCYECAGNGEVDCSECYGDGVIEVPDDSNVVYNIESWLTTNPKIIQTIEETEENSYMDRDDFENLLDEDESSTLFLGYLRNSDSMSDLISEYGFNQELSQNDNFILSISEPTLNAPLMRLVGYNKFSKMI